MRSTGVADSLPAFMRLASLFKTRTGWHKGWQARNSGESSEYMTILLLCTEDINCLSFCPPGVCVKATVRDTAGAKTLKMMRRVSSRTHDRAVRSSILLHQLSFITTSLSLSLPFHHSRRFERYSVMMRQNASTTQGLMDLAIPPLPSAPLR